MPQSAGGRCSGDVDRLDLSGAFKRSYRWGIG
jgi:hypothetical protein